MSSSPIVKALHFFCPRIASLESHHKVITHRNGMWVRLAFSCRIYFQQQYSSEHRKCPTNRYILMEYLLINVSLLFLPQKPNRPSLVNNSTTVPSISSSTLALKHIGLLKYFGGKSTQNLIGTHFHLISEL